MLRINRSRFLGIVCVCIFIYFIAFTDSGSSGSDFRLNTEAGLLRKQQREQDLPLRGHLSDEDLTKKTNEELQGILESQSKEKMGTDEDGKPLGRVYREPEHDLSFKEKEGYSREEPKKQKQFGPSSTKPPKAESTDTPSRDLKPKPKPKYPKPVDSEKTLKADENDDDGREADDAGSGSDPGMDFAREKLMGYLKNPVVIFSKSYCPHSKRAKHLLLEVYNIVPKPLVVELDMLGERIPTVDDPHGGATLGKALQELLAEITSRRTVPNIVVGGHHSIGGNDKIWEMHEDGSLADTIKSYGGVKITSVDINDKE